MPFYEELFVDTIYLISPILIYLFFVAHRQNIENKEKNLFLEVALISSFYLCIRFGEEKNFMYLLLHIPLLLAYGKRQKFSIFFLSFFLIFYGVNTFSIPFFLLLIIYGFYFVLFLILKKKNISLYLTFFLSVAVLTYVLLFHMYASISFSSLFLYAVTFLFLNGFVFFVLHKAENILKYHMSVKELEQEKQIRTSLFKITHEIKNPIAVCKGYLDMFDVNNVEHAKKYVPILKEEIERTLILLQDFLCFTKVTIESDILDIHFLLEEIIKNFSYLFLEKNITLEKNISEKEVFINGDYNRLSQVFINLLKNSMEALEKKKNPKILIQTKLEQDHIVIIIQDNGCGISEENLKKIRVPFFTTKKKGTGLGVSLSNEIILSHHGTLEYFSKENRGTKVIITLPVLKMH